MPAELPTSDTLHDELHASIASVTQAIPADEGGDDKITTEHPSVIAKELLRSLNTEPPKVAPKVVAAPTDTTPKPTDAAPAPKPDEQPRDQSGKFAPKGDPKAEKSAGVAATTEAPAAEVAAPEKPAEEVPPEEPAIPFRFKAYGEPVDIPGALYKPGHGVFIPESALGQTRQLMARGTQYDRLAQVNESLRSGTTRAQLEAQATQDILGPFLDEKNFADFANAFVANPHLVRAQLQARVATKLAELTTQYAGKILPDDVSGMGPDARGAQFDVLDTNLEHAFRSPTISAHLKTTPALRQHLEGRATRFASNFFVPAPYDAPNGSFKKGDQVFDSKNFHEFLTDEADLYVRANPKAQPKVAAPTDSTTAAPSSTPQKQISAPPSAASQMAPSASPSATAPAKPDSGKRAQPHFSRKQLRDEQSEALRQVVGA